MAARATTVGGLRRVPSELDDGEKGREDGEMAAGMEGQQWLCWWRPSPRYGEAWQSRTASRGRGRRPHPAGTAVFGGGVGGRLSAEKRSRWQRRPARRERRRWRPAWRERRSRWREFGLAREARPVEKARLARETRPAVEEATFGGGRGRSLAHEG
ncbi:hypothetical protein OsI_22831 [Oryza sativa Indica Group]|uniref:Uncharacterized protein n=1 Tax=Oryza sativa subsp. indica TaxID=39946 RepID=B8B1D4_ORYSI|nr:hypothetical protein OsI_22831 [Oryza sativa Indica Group]